jgi:hypothetical protein
MGGPGAQVLLRDPLTDRRKEELDSWLGSIAGVQEDRFGYSFWLKKDVFAESVSQCIFYFGLGNLEEWVEEDEHRQITEKLGYFPQQTIDIGSGCNQKSDHRTIGFLMLHLAEKYQGLINMGGAIQPPIKQELISEKSFIERRQKAAERKAFLQTKFKEIEAALSPGKSMKDVFRERYSNPDSPLNQLGAEMEEKFGPVWPQRKEPTLEEISAYVQAMPGKVYEIYYERANKTQWVYHIVDTTFLQAWMNHPNFYMNK